MGAKDTMQTFFMGMAGQMTSGYGARTISTPMGPFKWDDNINMWVNTNNGMVMSNISFQDQFAMIDYGTSDGSGLQGDPVTVSISPSSWGNYNLATGINDGSSWWASSANASRKGSATAVTFTIGGEGSITLSLSATVASGALQNIVYAINNGATINYSTPFTISNGQTLKLGLIANNASGASSIIVTNTTNGSVIEQILGSFTL
jgi:hypothetical protein